MKICVNCGQELQDEMKFCLDCGARQPVAVQRPAPRPEPAPPPAAAPVQQPRRQNVPAPEPDVPDPLWDDMPIPEDRRPKKRAKWPLILLGLVVAAGAAAGVYYARTVKQYDEMRYYEDDALVTVETYDDGRILSEEQYENDVLVFEQSYEQTDDAQEIDGSDMETIPGVTEVRRAQLSRGGVLSQVFVVEGYDRHGRILGRHVYEFDDAGNLLYEYTSEYTRDSLGYLTHWEQWTGDGELMLEVDLENTCSFGRLTSSVIHFKRNGRFLPTEDGGYEYQASAQPDVYTRTAEYQY